MLIFISILRNLLRKFYIIFKQALAKNGEYIGARYIKVEVSKGKNMEKSKNTFNLGQRKADSESIPPNCTTIFIKNLAYDITEEEIGQMFKPCGIISSIRLVYNSLLKHFKGYLLIISLGSVILNLLIVMVLKKL